MLEANVRRMLERVGDDQRVLEVGGWAKPLARADWVLDLMPYETRGLYGRDGRAEDERFSAETWVLRDICDREPWPFEDDSFDFVVCSHTLEDLRDPIWVCSELERIGKAGYSEVPSRLEEQVYGFEGPWVGWSHHRWLIDVEDTDITFVFKTTVIEREGAHFPTAFRDLLSPEDRIETMWWEGSFGYREHLFYEPPEMDAYLEDFVSRNLQSRGFSETTPKRSLADRALRRLRR